MTRVKICGLTNRSDLDAAVAAGVDAVGAIVDVPVDTPREIESTHARKLFGSVPPFVTTVLVSMPASVAAARELVRTVDPDAIQVHGTLDPSEVGELRDSIDIEVIVATDATSPAEARRYTDVADAILLDSTDETGAGGTGRTHDWNRSRAIARDLSVPVVLAGGLTPATVGEAVDVVEPYAVDVASGVEAQGGEKDHDAVTAFVAAATGGITA